MTRRPKSRSTQAVSTTGQTRRKFLKAATGAAAAAGLGFPAIATSQT